MTGLITFAKGGFVLAVFVCLFVCLSAGLLTNVINIGLLSCILVTLSNSVCLDGDSVYLGELSGSRARNIVTLRFAITSSNSLGFFVITE